VSRFPVQSLTPAGGTCSALVFNNPLAGVAPDLFWQFTITFAEVDYGGGCQPSMTIDWVPLRPLTWPQLVGRSAAGRYGDGGIEASFYTFEHDYGDTFGLQVMDRRGAEFLVRMAMAVDFHGSGEHDAYLLEVQAEAWLSFTGLTVQVVPPAPDAAEARRVAAEFISMEQFTCEQAAVGTGRRYRFVPTAPASAAPADRR
jgi:hypothetical protein